MIFFVVSHNKFQHFTPIISKINHIFMIFKKNLIMNLSHQEKF